MLRRLDPLSLNNSVRGMDMVKSGAGRVQTVPRWFSHSSCASHDGDERMFARSLTHEAFACSLGGRAACAPPRHTLTADCRRARPPLATPLRPPLAPPSAHTTAPQNPSRKHDAYLFFVSLALPESKTNKSDPGHQFMKTTQKYCVEYG